MSGTFTFGPGMNTLTGTSAGLNGDTITNYLPGDRIQITDLTKSNLNLTISGHTLSYSGGGSITIADAVPGRGPGREVVRDIPGGVEIRLQQDAHNDFSGDGASDVLFQNGNGSLMEWYDGSSYYETLFAPLDPFIHVVGTGDFNGDGLNDLLLRNDNGALAEWLSVPQTGYYENTFSANTAVDYALATDWLVAGVGDFNGDGRSDLLLRNTNGTLAEWTGKSDGSFVGNANANYALGANWHVVGTGDFNGDGTDDLLLRNDNGLLAEWTGKPDGSFVGNAPVNYPLGLDWKVLGIGDFNGDGRSDILLRNTNGILAEWTAKPDGSFAGNANVNYPLPLDWHIAQIGDFNGDGKDDLLLRNNNGLIGQWSGQPDGSFVSNPYGNDFLSLAWHVQDPFVHDTIV